MRREPREERHPSEARSTFNLCIRKLLGQVSGSSSNTTPHIQYPLGAGSLGPLQHLIYEVEFCLLEVFLLVALSPLFLGVVPQVYVLPPVVLQYPVPISQLLMTLDVLYLRHILSM